MAGVVSLEKLTPEIEGLGIKRVVIGFESNKVRQEGFVKNTGWSGALYIDDKRNSYDALGCLKKGSAWKGLKKSFSVPGSLLLKGNLSGDIDQQGGTFILDNKGTIIYSHQDKFAGDHPDYKELIKLCKDHLEKVNAAKSS